MRGTSLGQDPRTMGLLAHRLITPRAGARWSPISALSDVSLAAMPIEGRDRGGSRINVSGESKQVQEMVHVSSCLTSFSNLCEGSCGLSTL